MRKKINAILIPAIIVLLSIASIVLPAKDFSERENRYLASFPKFTWNNIKSGVFTEGISDYLSDHFPARDTWIEINTRKSLIQGKQLINGVYFAADDYLIEKYESASSIDKIAKVVNNFAEKVSAEVSFMAVPTSTCANYSRLPYGAEDNMNAQILDYNKLLDNLSCSKIYVSDLLFLANMETQNPVFYRLDHHWTSKGAFYGACAYKYHMQNEVFSPSSSSDLIDPLSYAREIKQFANTEIANYDFKVVSENFRGTLFNKVGECGLGYDTIEAIDLSDIDLEYETEDGVFNTIYDESKLQTADQYAYFLSGNHPISTITNKSNPDAPKLLIIKDSYANSLVPFLVENYSEITIIDPRYYGESVSDLVNNNAIDEVLFVYNMNTLGTDSGIRRVK